MARARFRESFRMSATVAVLMDPIARIHVEKDTSLALLLEAQRRGYRLLYMTQGDLALRNAEPWAHMAELRVRDDPNDWFTLEPPHWRDLREVEIVLARKDPPFDSQFLYDTMVLEIAQAAGVRVINDPRGLRDANEKIFSLHFPQCIPATIIARNAAEIRRFVAEHGDVVLKPLDGMGG